MPRELLKRALQELRHLQFANDSAVARLAILVKEIEAELAKPEQEPIFYGSKSAAHGGFLPCEKEFKGDSLWSPAVPLYESSPDYEAIKSELNAMNENCKGLIEERRKFKDQLFEAQQALLKEGMRANALQARIDGGIRIRAYRNSYDSLKLDNFEVKSSANATLIMDEGAEIGNFE